MKIDFEIKAFKNWNRPVRFSILMHDEDLVMSDVDGHLGEEWKVEPLQEGCHIFRILHPESNGDGTYSLPDMEAVKKEARWIIAEVTGELAGRLEKAAQLYRAAEEMKIELEVWRDVHLVTEK